MRKTYALIEEFSRLNPNLRLATIFQTMEPENPLPAFRRLSIELLADTTVSRKDKLQIATLANTLHCELPQRVTPFEVFTYIEDVFKSARIDIRYKKIYAKCVSASLKYANQSLVYAWTDLYRWMVDNEFDDTALVILEAVLAAELMEGDFIFIISSIWKIPLHKRVEKEWGEIFYEVIKYLMTDLKTKSYPTYELLQEMCKYNELSKKILRICYETSIFVSPDLKTPYLQIHNKLIQFSNRQKIMHEIPVELTQKCIPILLQRLVNICRNGLEKQQIYSEITEASLEILTSFLKINTLTPAFYPFNKNLLFDIILPLLTTTSKQINQFYEQPQSFMEEYQDIVYSQQIPSVKSGASMILQAVIDYIDGMLNTIVGICVNSILKTDQSIITCDLGFQLLTTINYNISKSPDMKMRIKAMLRCKEVFNNMTDLEMYKMFVFLAFSYTDIYNENLAEGYHLIEFASNFQSKQGPTMRAAIDMLFSITDEFYDEKIFNNLCIKVVSCEIPLLFQTLVEFIKKGHLEIRIECVSNLLDLVFTRISNDVHNKNTHFLIKCLDVVQQICNYKQFISNDAVRNKLWKVGQLLKYTVQSLSSTDYAENIIKIINILLEAEPLIDHHMYQLLPYCRVILEKNDFVLYELFVTFNLYIAKLQQDYLNCLLDLLILQGIKSQSIESVCQVLLLLQVYSDKYGKDRKKNQFIMLFTQNLLNKYRELGQKVELFLSRIINLQLLLYCFNPQNKTLIFTRLLDKYDEVYQGLQIRILVVVVCRLLFVQTDFIMLGQLVTIIVSTLYKYNNHSKQDTAKKLYEGCTINQLIWKEIKDIDIFQHFKSSLQQMKANNPVVYQELFKYITKQTTHQLAQIQSMVEIGRKTRKIFKISNAVYKPHQVNISIEEEPEIKEEVDVIKKKRRRFQEN